jgi:agmatinase
MSDPTPQRFGMAYTGVATFARAPHILLPERAEELVEQRPDFVVYGLPFDCAIGYRPGQRLAPRAIRDMSTRFAMEWGANNPGFWDIETDRLYLQGASLVDAGDVDPLYFDLDHLDASAGALVGAAAAVGAVPIGLGGDHSVSYPAIKALAPFFAPGGRYHGKKLEIVQIDAHLDFTDTMGGTFKRSNSSPMRRAAELDFVGGITCIGLRGLRTNPAAYQAARERGHRLVLAREIREQGVQAALDVLPEDSLVYITLDIDGLDPSVAPGTSSPEFDGLTYAQVREILRATAAWNQVIAADVVEVNPYLDVANLTSLLAARAVVEMMAFIHARKQEA